MPTLIYTIQQKTGFFYFLFALSKYAQWVGTPILLMLSGILIYLPSLHYGFLFDDLEHITKHFAIRHDSLKTVFFKSSRWISSWLNTVYYSYGKFDPFIYRVGNVTIHIISSILIFYIFFLLLRNLKHTHAFILSFITSSLFLIHPVQTQTVSYIIQGQLEGLATLFVLAILLCFTVSFTPTHSAILRKIALMLLFLIGILSVGTKEIAIVSPLLLLLTDWFFVAQANKDKLRSRLWFYGIYTCFILGFYIYFLKPSFFVHLLGFTLEAKNTFGNTLTENPYEKIRPFIYCISQFKVIIHYITIFFWPFNICVDYDWKLVPSFFSGQCLVPLALLVTIAWATIKRFRRNKLDLVSFALSWFFVVILPRSSIIPSAELLADYKTYLASVGIFFAIALLMLSLYSWIKDKIAHVQYLSIIILSLSTLGLSYTTCNRNKVWSSAEKFWLNNIIHAPRKARAQNNYGLALTDKSNHMQAIEHFKKALELEPHYSQAWNNLAVCYVALNDLDSAIETLEKSIALYPAPECFNNLGSLLLIKQKFSQAEMALKRAISKRTTYGKAWHNLGRVYDAQERYEEAYQAFKHACTQADFDNQEGFISYGMICAKLKNYSEAIQAYTKAAELNPSSPKIAAILFDLALCYKNAQDYYKSCELFNKLTNLEPNNAHCWAGLGDSYTLLSDYEQAYDAYCQVVELMPMAPDIYIKLASTLKALGEIQDARQLLEDFLRQNPPEKYKQQALKALELL